MGVPQKVKCRWNCWNSGFTLLECLVALLVLNVFMLTITFLVPQVKWVREAIGHNREHQFELFLLQLEHELKDGEYEAYDNGIQVNKLVKEGGRWVPKKVLIHQYQDKIRKTFRSSGGHQPMLMGIQQARFIEKDGYVLIKVRYPDGEVNHGKWTIP